MWEKEEPMWVAPDSFPDLNKFKFVAIDLETKDPDLKKRGSGAIRNVGHIIGAAVAVNEDGFKYSQYFPCRHEAGKTENLDPKIL